jgi:hypothetical protein
MTAIGVTMVVLTLAHNESLFDVVCTLSEHYSFARTLPQYYRIGGLSSYGIDVIVGTALSAMGLLLKGGG